MTLGSLSRRLASYIASPRPDHWATVAVIQNALMARTREARAVTVRRGGAAASGGGGAARGGGGGRGGGGRGGGQPDPARNGPPPAAISSGVTSPYSCQSRRN